MREEGNVVTGRIFEVFTQLGAEWVLWLLLALSVVSIGLILERVVFFVRNGAADDGRIAAALIGGRLDEARKLLAGRRGLQAAVLREALAAAPLGAASVEEVLAGAVARERPAYERSLAFLGTLGNNAPFIGLFGTVIGIIQAFAHLAIEGGAKDAGVGAVMSGISEALVATAVGIFVAIPAVVAFNGFNRWLKTLVARTQSLGHSLIAHLQAEV